jgi:hypothetical protein
LNDLLGDEIGESTVFIPRSDECGQSAGRTCESLVGDVTTDAMRTAYGTDFAITNSGGLRADLTCPTVDDPTDFCPPNLQSKHLDLPQPSGLRSEGLRHYEISTRKPIEEK